LNKNKRVSCIKPTPTTKTLTPWRLACKPLSAHFSSDSLVIYPFMAPGVPFYCGFVSPSPCPLRLCYNTPFYSLSNTRYQKQVDDAIVKVAKMADDVKAQALADPDGYTNEVLARLLLSFDSSLSLSLDF
jgi:hypothetical protein